MGSDDYKALLAKQKACMNELEGQVTEAAKTAEAVDALHGGIEQLRVQAADERVKYELRLVGVCNVKATKAFLDDRDSDVAETKKRGGRAAAGELMHTEEPNDEDAI